MKIFVTLRLYFTLELYDYRFPLNYTGENYFTRVYITTLHNIVLSLRLCIHLTIHTYLTMHTYLYYRISIYVLYANLQCVKINY